MPSALSPPSDPAGQPVSDVASPSSWRSFGLALLGGMLVLALVELPRWTRPPLPLELVAAGVVPGAYADGPARWVVAWTPTARAALVLATTLLVALLLAFAAGLRSRAGGFGVLAAGAAGALGCEAALHFAWGQWWALALPLPVAALAAGAAPCLRDRNLIWLLGISVLLALAVAAARRQALDEGLRAQRLAQAREQVLARGVERLVALVPADFDEELRRGLALSLWPPRNAFALQVLCVESGTDEAAALRAADWAEVRIEAPAPLAGAGDGAESAGRGAGDALGLVGRELRVAVPRGRGPEVVVTPSEGVFELVVVTPAGPVRQRVSSPTHGVGLIGAARSRFDALVDGLPASIPVWLQLRDLDAGRASEWLRWPPEPAP